MQPKYGEINLEVNGIDLVGGGKPTCTNRKTCQSFNEFHGLTGFSINKRIISIQVYCVLFLHTFL